VYILRERLEEYANKAVTLKGKFFKYGRKKDPNDVCFWTTVLLKDISFLNGSPACDHLWFIAKEDFLKVELHQRALIQVSGFVHSYTRKNGSRDYSIRDYISVKVVSQGSGSIRPAKVWSYSGYEYFKFILDGGARWYRTKFGKLERIVYEKVPNKKDFNIFIVPFDIYDKPPVWYIISTSEDNTLRANYFIGGGYSLEGIKLDSSPIFKLHIDDL
jgi:hypothetical protein